MLNEALAVVAEPTRRRILDELLEGEHTVGELVEVIAVSQPSISKHLRVLRDAGFVSSRTDAQHRRYRLEPLRLEAIDHWLAPYRILWTRHLDALERHLEEQETK